MTIEAQQICIVYVGDSVGRRKSGRIEQSLIDAELNALSLRYEAQRTSDALLCAARSMWIAERNRAQAAKQAMAFGSNPKLYKGRH